MRIGWWLVAPKRHAEERRVDPKNAVTKFQWSGMLNPSAQPRWYHAAPACARTQDGDGGTNRLSLGAHSHYDVSVASYPLTCGIADGIFPDCQPIPPYNHGSGIRV